jgi:hypothetical protein
MSKEHFDELNDNHGPKCFVHYHSYVTFVVKEENPAKYVRFLH